MMDVQITGQDSVNARLSNFGAQLPMALGEVLKGMSEALLSEYVSPLVKYSSGRLAASLSASVEEKGGQMAAVISAQAPYAGFIEYGFQGIETVAGYMRNQRMAWGRAMASPKDVWVRAHSRNVDAPAHSYLRAGLADYAATGAVANGMSTAVKEAMS
jgi:hypothetical protein